MKIKSAAISLGGLLASLALTAKSPALTVTDDLEISGNIRNESAFRVSDPAKWVKFKNSITMKADYSPLDWFSAFVNLRYYYDSAYDINDELSADAAHQLRRPRKTWDWLREGYLDYHSDLLDLRAGQQTIVWGTADGVKVLDIVCPMDMREFTLAPFDESRIPLWMGKAEFSPTVNGTLQLFAAPYFEPNYIPPGGSPFTFRATSLGDESIDGLRLLGYNIDEIDDQPSNTGENAKFGFRWRDIIENFEYTLNYFQGHNISSVTDVSVDPSTATGPPPAPGLPPAGSTFRFTKKYPYIHVLGTSCSYGFNSGALEGLTLRGEFAYVRGDRNGYGEDGSQKGLTNVDRYNYVIGLDRYFFVKYLFSFQFIQFIDSKDTVTDPVTGKEYQLLMGPTYHPRDQVETMFSLKVSTQYFWIA